MGLDVRELPLLPAREKYFLLTSPFIEPAVPPAEAGSGIYQVTFTAGWDPRLTQMAPCGLGV